MPDQNDILLGQAVRRALSDTGFSQIELGELVARLEHRPEPYSQAAVSKWLEGVGLAPTRVFLIEKALGLRAGTLSRIGGYLPIGTKEIRTVIDAIKADPALEDRDRRMLEAAYRAAVRSPR